MAERSFTRGRCRVSDEFSSSDKDNVVLVTRADLRRKEKGWSSFGRVLDEKMRADMDMAAEKLVLRRELLYEHQCLLFPMLGKHIAKVGDLQATVYLPSVLPSALRAEYGLQRISELEIECRSRLAVKCVINLQEAIRNLDALGQYKNLNDRGQDQNTESTRTMTSYKRMRDALIEDYGRHRTALISLDALPEGSSDLPPLALKDTWRKSTLTTRSAGASRHRDAALWVAGGHTTLMEGRARVGVVESTVVDQDVRDRSLTDVSASFTEVRTQMSRRDSKRAKPSGPQPKGKVSPKEITEPQENGWIWRRNVVLGQTEDEWASERKSIRP